MSTSTWQYTLPIAILIFIAEFWLSRREEKHLYDKKDTRNNFIMGVLSFVSNFASKLVSFAVYEWLYLFRIFNLHAAWWVSIACFLCVDLSYYWYHRSAHRINWFWASHSVHHSSELYNISTGFRNSWTIHFTGQFIFWSWMPLLGFDPVMLIFTYQLCIFYQSWLHTETIDKLPQIIEFIFNTPSHHRVHHGSDEKYIDKNHGGILMIWDRLFNTYQEEEEHPAYGLTEETGTENPFQLTIIGWKKLGTKVFQSRSWKTGILYLLKAPSWKPDETTTVKKYKIKKNDPNCLAAFPA
jgi:sterol desaturase/sphingolipid hydroxylase (fatty acid hydroxylase superfamily)